MRWSRRGGLRSSYANCKSFCPRSLLSCCRMHRRALLVAICIAIDASFVAAVSPSKSTTAALTRSKTGTASRTPTSSQTGSPATQTSSPSETASATPYPVLSTELWGVVDFSEYGDSVTIIPQTLLRDLTNGELYLNLLESVSCDGGCPVTSSADLWHAWYDGSTYYPNVVSQGSQDPFATVSKPAKDFISYWRFARLALRPLGNATFGSDVVDAFNVSIDLFDSFGSVSIVTDEQANNDR